MHSSLLYSGITTEYLVPTKLPPFKFHHTYRQPFYRRQFTRATPLSITANYPGLSQQIFLNQQSDRTLSDTVRRTVRSQPSLGNGCLPFGYPLCRRCHKQDSHADFSTTFSVFSAVVCPCSTPWVLSFISRILMVAKISFRSSAKDILLMYIRSIFSLSLGSVL